jgi:hypothetical protein
LGALLLPAGPPADAANGGFTEQAQLPYGSQVAISGDGRVLLVGGAESALIFTRSSSGWSPTASLPPESEGGPPVFPPEGFGDSVALSADGTTAIVGAPAYNGNAGVVVSFTEEGCLGSARPRESPA